MSIEIYKHLEEHGEKIAANMKGVAGYSITHMQSRLSLLAKRGKLERRKVVPKPNSSAEIWAYRLPGQAQTLHSFQPSSTKNQRRERTNKEPFYCFILRNLPRLDTQQRV
jgi:hypothetical protein